MSADKDPNPLPGLPTEGREVDLEAHFIGSSDDGWDHQPTAAYTRHMRTEKIFSPCMEKTRAERTNFGWVSPGPQGGDAHA